MSQLFTLELYSLSREPDKTNDFRHEINKTLAAGIGYVGRSKRQPLEQLSK